MSEDLRIEAAEYVLGTLDAAERAAFVRRLAGDADVRRETAAIAFRFSGLIDGFEPVAPSAAVWAGISRRLDVPMEAAEAPANVVVLRRPPVARRFAWGAVAAIAAALLLFVVTRDLTQGPQAGGTQVAQNLPTAPSAAPAAPEPQAGVSAIVPAAPAAGPPARLATAEPAEASGHAGSVSTAAASPGQGSVSLGGATVGADMRRPSASVDRSDTISQPSARVADARPTATPKYVAVLAGEGNAAGPTVHIDVTARSLMIQLPPAGLPSGKNLEFWYAHNGEPFRPIGPVAADATELAMPPDMATDETVIAASLVDAGASTAASPTAPMTYQGTITRE